jgi:hypothetical protein
MLACPLCDQVVLDGTCACGSAARVQLDKNSVILAFHGDHGFPCQRCGTVDQDLALRLYKRVVGAFVIDRMYSTGGYFCKPCRRALFAKHMGLTLVLGWWGVFALLFRNPFAILSNLRALRSPPPAPQDFGGLPLRGAYPTADEQASQADVRAGLVPDTWHCTLCDSYIVGSDNVQRHADRDHPRVGFKKMRAALVCVREPLPGPNLPP